MVILLMAVILRPVQASSSSDNIEDCQWHIFRITWDPVTQLLRAYFDGHLQVQAQVNIIGTIFNNDPNVFWGFTAATGGADNLQQFCTALNPDFSTNVEQMVFALALQLLSLIILFHLRPYNHGIGILEMVRQVM
jgi:hypothetical protein